MLSIERCHFQLPVPWTTVTLISKSFHHLMLNVSETVEDRDIITMGILLGTYMCPAQGCHFELSWVTLTDLAKCLNIQSVARPLCDSWAFCLFGIEVCSHLSICRVLTVDIDVILAGGDSWLKVLWSFDYSSLCLPTRFFITSVRTQFLLWTSTGWWWWWWWWCWRSYRWYKVDYYRWRDGFGIIQSADIDKSSVCESSCYIFCMRLLCNESLWCRCIIPHPPWPHLISDVGLELEGTLINCSLL